MKKSDKFVYVVLDKNNALLYKSKNINKIAKFMKKYGKIFNVYPSMLSTYLVLTTLDEYNKNNSEEKMIDDMYKEYLECQNKIRVNVKLS